MIKLVHGMPFRRWEATLFVVMTAMITTALLNLVSSEEDLIYVYVENIVISLIAFFILELVLFRSFFSKIKILDGNLYFNKDKEIIKINLNNSLDFSTLTEKNWDGSKQLVIKSDEKEIKIILRPYLMKLIFKEIDKLDDRDNYSRILAVVN